MDQPHINSCNNPNYSQHMWRSHRESNTALLSVLYTHSSRIQPTHTIDTPSSLTHSGPVHGLCITAHAPCQCLFAACCSEMICFAALVLSLQGAAAAQMDLQQSTTQILASSACNSSLATTVVSSTQTFSEWLTALCHLHCTVVSTSSAFRKHTKSKQTNEVLVVRQNHPRQL